MARSHNGEHRHRQPWIRITCPTCGLSCLAKRTRPGHDMWIKTHFDNDGELCPPLRFDETRAPRPIPGARGNRDQLTLFG